MKTPLKISLVLLGFFLLTGCATTGPKFADLAPTISSVTPGSGRIYLYRTSAFGAAVQPAVKLNGEVIGKAVPKGFFYVDRKPGNYEIITKTEVTRTLSLTLDEGQIRYVRLNISMGFFVGHVYPELVGKETGESEIQNCRYIGKQKEFHEALKLEEAPLKKKLIPTDKGTPDVDRPYPRKEQLPAPPIEQAEPVTLSVYSQLRLPKYEISRQVPDPSPEMMALPGRWQGIWDMTGTPSALIIQKIEGRKVDLIYAWGLWGPMKERQPGHIRITGDLTGPEPVIKFQYADAKFTFVLGEGDKLIGSWDQKNSPPDRIEMKKVDWPYPEKDIPLTSPIEKAKPTITRKFADVTLPEYEISPPPTNAPPEIRGLLGRWQGYWKNGVAIAMVFLKVYPDERRVECIHAIGHWGPNKERKPAFHRLFANLTPGPKPQIKFRLADGDFTFTLEGNLLYGTRKSKDRVVKVTLEKAE